VQLSRTQYYKYNKGKTNAIVLLDHTSTNLLLIPVQQLEFLNRDAFLIGLFQELLAICRRDVLQVVSAEWQVSSFAEQALDVACVTNSGPARPLYDYPVEALQVWLPRKIDLISQRNGTLNVCNCKFDPLPRVCCGGGTWWLPELDCALGAFAEWREIPAEWRVLEIFLGFLGSAELAVFRITTHEQN